MPNHFSRFDHRELLRVNGNAEKYLAEHAELQLPIEVEITPVEIAAACNWSVPTCQRGIQRLLMVGIISRASGRHRYIVHVSQLADLMRR
ncbi:hypothetical protein [Sulfobacillus thermosulfidooxidans]|uniref:hypothetical protein n=1 Tax=Sulfobacillus thermosulfidooxidans TaxID=28034 RepID=UPI00031EB314|nr:hypothetical protein [Sulfobacillus thermosulfidooxidans]